MQQHLSLTSALVVLLISGCLVEFTFCGPLSTPRTWTPPCKQRGLGHQFNSTRTLNAVARQTKITWWYDWGWQLKPKVVAKSFARNLTFVPMQWSKWSIDLLAPEKLPPQAKYLLGYNEPNHNEQAKLTPQEAAALWPKVQAVADQLGLLLGTPAAAPCGANCLNPDPFSWWDQFFALCQGCRFDFLATHYYSCNPTALASYLQTCRKYGLPIWLTEFACPNQGTSGPAAPINYMPQALTLLDNDPWVATYAWFGASIPTTSWLAYNGLMDFQTFKATALGKIYRTHRSPTCSTPASSTVQFLGPSSAATRRSTGDWVAKCGRCVEAVSGAGLASLTLEEQQLCSDCGFLNAKDAQAVARARRLHSA